MVGRGFTTTVYEMLADALFESVAFTENEKLVGVKTNGAVPLKTLPWSVSHPGKPVGVSVMVPVPPVVVIDGEYATPVVVGGKVAGERPIAGFTSKVSCCESKAVAESVAFTVKVAVVGDATALGCPLITPALNDIPAGTEPVTRVQTNPGVPPVTVRVRVQDVPAVQAGIGFVLIAGAGLITNVKLA
jgi:hypothetical protein